MNIIKFASASFILLSLAACSSYSKDGAPKGHVDLSKIKNPTPHTLPLSKSGNPKQYTIKGKTYHPLRSSKGYHAVGYASWYGTKFDGHLTASGEVYDMYKMTAANKVLPIPCYVKVTNLNTKQSIIVKVNDRGPFRKNRIIDLSYVAALKLGMFKHGTALVSVVALDPGKSILQQGMKNLYVQAGAFTHPDYANRLAKKLAQLTHYPTRQTQITVNNRELTRVYIGPLNTVDDSIAVSKQLEKLGIKNPRMVTDLKTL